MYTFGLGLVGFARNYSDRNVISFNVRRNTIARNASLATKLIFFRRLTAKAKNFIFSENEQRKKKHSFGKEKRAIVETNQVSQCSCWFHAEAINMSGHNATLAEHLRNPNARDAIAAEHIYIF